MCRISVRIRAGVTIRVRIRIRGRVGVGVLTIAHPASSHHAVGNFPQRAVDLLLG